jgi:Domain of unknown function (DUF397)
MVHWRKSTHSGAVNDEACVEVARLSAGLTGVRDQSKSWSAVSTVTTRRSQSSS